MIFDPHDNIWQADDGRLWSSATMGPLDAQAPELSDWLDRGGILTTWPRDEAGEQTQVALNAVLAHYGIAVDLASYAATVRLAREVAGIEVGGAQIRTDRESQSLIAGAHALALAEPSEPIEFKAADGWVSIDSAAMILIAQAVARHVRDGFRRERLIAEEIAAGTITTRAEVDAAFAG